MRNIKLTIQYRGTNFYGWQIQPISPTIQEVFQNILSEICHEKINLLAVSRTDSGVHALGQIAHFKTSHAMDIETLQRALNAKLPDDILVLKVEEVPLTFHSQENVRSKTYTYLLYNSYQKSPFLDPITWRIYGLLHLKEMQQCLEMLVGEHDFNAFKAADSTAKTSIRKMDAVSLQRIPLSNLGNNFIGILGLEGMVPLLNPQSSKNNNQEEASVIAVNFRGQGFLKHMVRNIVGTLAYVGLGKISVEEFRRILESRDRTQAGMTAPAQGLFLVKVEY